jgi:meiotically up-regulated gene 157 (Mug157) protein
MYAGGVLKRVDGLTYDKLTYFVRAGYLNPRKIKSQSLYYNDFSEEDVEVIKRAWELISKHKVKIKTAFERAREKGEDIQLTLNLITSSKNSG